MRYILICVLVLFGNQVKSLELSEFYKLSDKTQEWYLYGVMEGILYTQAGAETLKKGEVYTCVPGNIQYSDDLAKVALQNFRKENKQDMPVAMAVILGLIEIFPCN